MRQDLANRGGGHGHGDLLAKFHTAKHGFFALTENYCVRVIVYLAFQELRHQRHNYPARRLDEVKLLAIRLCALRSYALNKQLNEESPFAGPLRSMLRSP